MDDLTVRTEFPREVREIENTWIPMPDGTKLAARIWLPVDAEDDPVPAILEYLPYRKRDGTVERDHLTHPYFAGFGYAGVRVDMRGTGDSEGVCLGEYLFQEQDDAMAVIDWLAAQPWCSGKVGMIGISWGGFNGLQVAARRPPALGAVISLCSTDDRYADDIHFMGGCLLTDKLAWGATAFSIANTPPDPAIVGERWRDIWQERIANNGLWMLDWFRHQRRDSFYAHGSVCENYDDIEVPVYMVGGWADGYTNAIFRTLDHLPGPKKGLVGPWAHKYPHFAKPGPRIGFLQECLRWWDQHLKGIDTGIMEEPQLLAWINDPAFPMAYRDERPGSWVSLPSWSGFALESHPLAAPALAEEITLCSPQTAGHASGAWCGYGMTPDGPLDQNQETGLTWFETAPLEEDLELLGFPILSAKAQSDQPQANVAAVLSAVNESGSATLVSYGVLNLTHRDSHANPTPMPDGAVSIRLQLNACGQRIVKGQRLRLALGTSYWPVIWPSQSKVQVTLTDARLDLPICTGKPVESQFGPPESAEPVETEALTEPVIRRSRTIDHVSGVETYLRQSDTGKNTYMHTGTTTQYETEEIFKIHPDDPNSALCDIHWSKAYTRDDWQARVETHVRVEALATNWRITAGLRALEGDDVVAERSWNEDIPRDLV